MDSKWNIWINNKGFFTSITPNNKDIHLGKRDSNVEGDLVVEHHNLSFKVCIFCFFYWHKILVEMDVCIQDTLENLKGSYEDDRIATMAVSIDIKKELEAKLYPSYADGCV